MVEHSSTQDPPPGQYSDSGRRHPVSHPSRRRGCLRLHSETLHLNNLSHVVLSRNAKGVHDGDKFRRDATSGSLRSGEVGTRIRRQSFDEKTVTVGRGQVREGPRSG